MSLTIAGGAKKVWMQAAKAAVYISRHPAAAATWWRHGPGRAGEQLTFPSSQHRSVLGTGDSVLRGVLLPHGEMAIHDTHFAQAWDTDEGTVKLSSTIISKKCSVSCGRGGALTFY